MSGHKERIHERDLILPTLQILAAAPSGFLETTQLISELEARFKPAGKDAELLDGRSDTHFSQKVRNIISHKQTSENPIKKGWIEHDKKRKGLKITKAGVLALKSLPD